MTNRLAQENSLYLRQHADNPVDWHPWNAEALALARQARKPILMSIGYSACHWCHVMAHESFEDAATAQVMNELFVNIKVDREERPDLDRIYQLAHQALARRGGGWPLTVFLAPDDLIPFYAGTYFPPAPRHGLPAFVEVLQGVRKWFDEHPDDLAQQNAALAEFLADHGRGDAHTQALDATPLTEARRRIAAGFDGEHGGHRGAPKFPPATELELLQRLARDGDDEAGAMVKLSLRRMAERGLQDHLGGGFFRYSVDAQWSIPHFEKMLYDNAALLALYADAAARDAEPEFVAAATGIVAWLQREMRLTDGGYASALDADSEGEEGRYYVWSREQVGAVLDDPAFDPGRVDFFRDYALSDDPNFEHHAWHLQRRATLESQPDYRAERDALLRARATRVPPARDDKRLTAWNAMLVRALARGAQPSPLQGQAWPVPGSSPGQALSLSKDGGDGFGYGTHWLGLADGILTTLHTQAWRDGVLYAIAPEHGTRIAGFLDDHAFLLDALLERLQAGWRDRDLDWAVQLADLLLREFEDREHGGFWFTRHSHEPLPQRPKPWFDESTPSGNAVAARALLRLGHLLGETRWLDAAERTLRAGWPALQDAPHGACALLNALHEYLHPPVVIVLRANPGEHANWSQALAIARRAGSEVYVLDADAAALRDKPHRDGGVAYVCVGMRCLEPVTVVEELAARIRDATPSSPLPSPGPKA